MKDEITIDGVVYVRKDDPLAEVKAAHKAGKVIQTRIHGLSEEWDDWRPEFTPNFTPSTTVMCRLIGLAGRSHSAAQTL